MKKFFALYVVSLIAVMVGVTSARASTIALWTFEDGIAGNPANIVTDSVGGNNGVAISNPVYVDGAKSTYGNTGLSFNGTNQTVFVDSTSGGDLELAGDFTIELGLYTPANLSTGFAVFMGDSQNCKDPYYFYVAADGSLGFQIYGVADATVSLTSAPGLFGGSGPHQFAAVFDFDDVNGTDNFMRLFVDNTEVANLNVGTIAPYYGDTDSDFWIGSVANQFGFISGTLTDVRISNVALTGDQMLAVPEPGILALFGIGLVGLGLAKRRKG